MLYFPVPRMMSRTKYMLMKSWGALPRIKKSGYQSMKIKIEAICYGGHFTADFVRQPSVFINRNTPISFLMKFPWDDFLKVSVSFHVSKRGTLTLRGHHCWVRIGCRCHCGLRALRSVKDVLESLTGFQGCCLSHLMLFLISDLHDWPSLQ